MSADTPAEFRAKATATYARIRIWLIRMVIGAGVLGFVAGALIGAAIRAHQKYPEDPQGPGWFLAGLIGLVAGVACAGIIAVLILIPITLLYAMTQDDA